MRGLLAVALMLVGCGGKATIGELCDKTDAAYCDRAVQCFNANYDQCFQVLKARCCINAGKCKIEPEDIDDTDSYLDLCVPAIRASSCNAIQAGVLPSVCLMDR